MDKLPTDVIVYMALNMDLPEILSLCKTSSKFNKAICLNDNFWRDRLKKDYDIHEKPSNITNKKYYEYIVDLIKLKNPDVSLQRAANTNDVNIIKIFHDRGANIHFWDDWLMIHSAGRGSLDVTKYLLEHGADIHAQNDKALMESIEYGRVETVKYLIDNGSVIHDNDKAMMYIGESGNLDLLKYFVSIGYDMQGNNGSLILKSTADLDTIKYLVSNGVDVTSRNNGALRYAALRKDIPAIDYLMEQGADADRLLNNFLLDPNIRRHLASKQISKDWVTM